MPTNDFEYRFELWIENNSPVGVKNTISTTKNFKIINAPQNLEYLMLVFDKNINTNSTRIRFIVSDPENVDNETSKWNNTINLTNIKFEYKTPKMNFWEPLYAIQDENYTYINLLSTANSGKYLVNINDNNSYFRDNTQINLKISLPTSLTNYEFIIGNEKEKITMSEYTDAELSQKICDELNSHLPVSAF